MSMVLHEICSLQSCCQDSVAENNSLTCGCYGRYKYTCTILRKMSLRETDPQTHSLTWFSANVSCIDTVHERERDRGKHTERPLQECCLQIGRKYAPLSASIQTCAVTPPPRHALFIDCETTVKRANFSQIMWATRVGISSLLSHSKIHPSR